MITDQCCALDRFKIEKLVVGIEVVFSFSLYISWTSPPSDIFPRLLTGSVLTVLYNNSNTVTTFQNSISQSYE